LLTGASSIRWNRIEWRNQSRELPYEVVDVGEGEGAVPGEGVEVGGDDPEEALGVGVEEERAARLLLMVALRLGLAEDGGRLHRRRRHRSLEETERTPCSLEGVKKGMETNSGFVWIGGYQAGICILSATV
jgi:hypothetical protein